MAFTKSFIPYGGYWTSPYAKWQGSFANIHAIELASATAKKFFEKSGINPEKFNSLYLGQTIPQPHCFYGGPWLAGMIGNGKITGPVINQACSTGVICVKYASQDMECGIVEASLVIAADRCSNGPHLYYPSQIGPGGLGQTEDWVWDNFGQDPWAKNSMIQTAENVAKANDIGREEQDEVAQRRYEQYQAALADDGAFHKRYMIPVEVGREAVVRAGEGVPYGPDAGAGPSLVAEDFERKAPQALPGHGRQLHPGIPDLRARLPCVRKNAAAARPGRSGPELPLAPPEEGDHDLGARRGAFGVAAR